MSRSSDAPSFAHRTGDAAEQKFIEYATAKGMGVERYGFDRTPLRNFHLLPSLVKGTPDFVATTRRSGFLVECKAGGNGDVVNIKKSDWKNLIAWDAIAPVFVFFNDSKRKKVSLVSVAELISIHRDHKEYVGEGAWHDGVQFWTFAKVALSWESYHDF